MLLQPDLFLVIMKIMVLLSKQVVLIFDGIDITSQRILLTKILAAIIAGMVILTFIFCCAGIVPTY